MASSDIVLTRGYYIITHYLEGSHSMQSYQTFAVNEDEAMGKFYREIKGRKFHAIKCLIKPVSISPKIFSRII